MSRSYEGMGNLSEFFAEVKPLADDAMRKMAEAAGDRQVALTKENTPIADIPAEFADRFRGHREPPGHLRESITKKALVERIDDVGQRVFESGAETDVDYAPFVESGTGLWGPKHSYYDIRPKRPGGVLAFFGRATPFSLGAAGHINLSGLVFAKRVRHPGSPGQHFFAIGAHLVEAEFSQIAQRPIRDFKREVEAIHKHA